MLKFDFLFWLFTTQLIILNNCLNNNDDKGGGSILDQLGYNYDEISDSSEAQSTTTAQSTTLSTNDYSCQLQVQSETYTTKQDILYVAYAGNAYNYEVSCNVNDAKMRPGDKYYIIDLIIYGPNNRVQRAWREQFNSNALSKTRNLSINKKVSYRWLGMNSIVCSVTKYNYLINKFTRTCQKTSKVNVTEKSPKYGEFSQSNGYFINLLTSTTVYGGDNFIFKSHYRSTSSSSTTTTKSTTSFVENLKSKSNNLIKYDYYDDSDELTIQTKQISSKETTKLISSDSHVIINSNLSAKAMQFRDVYEINHNEDKISNNSKKVSPNQKINKTINVEHLLNRRIKFLQPLFVVSLFLIIFFVSIAVIIYLTYYQKTIDNRRHRNSILKTRNDEMLSDKNIKPIVVESSSSSTSQDQSGESMELSQSLTNENISQYTESETNKNKKNLFKKLTSQITKTKVTRTIMIKRNGKNKKSQKCEYKSACSSSDPSYDHSPSNECSQSNSSDFIESKNSKKSVINSKVECEDCEIYEWDNNKKQTD